MGSGRANDELTSGAKKARECRRREKNQRKRLLALGMSEAAVARLNTKQLRQLLVRPERTRQLLAAKKPVL
jgi:hypothetical protein